MNTKVMWKSFQQSCKPKAGIKIIAQGDMDFLYPGSLRKDKDELKSRPWTGSFDKHQNKLNLSQMERTCDANTGWPLTVLQQLLLWSHEIALSDIIIPPWGCGLIFTCPTREQLINRLKLDFDLWNARAILGPFCTISYGALNVFVTTVISSPQSNSCPPPPKKLHICFGAGVFIFTLFILHLGKWNISLI